ncbi:LysR family transcriptional regulator [Erwinia sp. S43]|uniref:LysR family transcriptional regulator n=1 Tax=unclassified Erwinia TaxID=2622719 RepID=UPI00190BD71B|nr:MULTISPECIES: LysR family transcriptional regulator [unclassified Erwinia]MBK0030946.1 LysR family transcriptional regulator [Erwinia sp. S43]MCW1876321.1 LysR family transcriptional regulator [Erwinia sp. INIA01]
MNIPNLSGYLNQFQIFIKIAETGNLSRAARELGLTPSAVSKSLSQLESITGNLLINRESRPFQLTLDGRRILQLAQRVIADIESIADGSRVPGMQGETLRISCSVAFGCTHIPTLSSDFQARYPGIGINVMLDDRFINLDREDIDVAFRITSEAATQNEDAEQLMDIRWFYCASPEYLRCHPPITVPADLRFHHCLVYPQMTHDGKWMFRHHTRSETVAVTPHLSCNSSLLLLQRALLHGGVACLPDYLACHYINSGKLVRVLSDYDPGVTHRLQARVRHSARDNKTLNLFLAFIKSRLVQNCDPTADI